MSVAMATEARTGFFKMQFMPLACHHLSLGLKRWRSCNNRCCFQGGVSPLSLVQGPSENPGANK
jgi:hypothetical protein